MSDPNPSVLLIGAGPAGISAALWLAEFEVPFHWVDTSGEAGGQLVRVHNQIRNVPGGIFDDGAALVSRLQDHVQKRRLTLRQARVVSIRPEEDGVRIKMEDQSSIAVKRVILATGTSYRKLGVPGEEEGLSGKWISQSAAGDAERVAGQPVAVVGGGDAGFENALRLARVDCDVTLFLRSSSLRARPAFVRAVEEAPQITIAPIPSIVEKIERPSPVESLPGSEGGLGCMLTIDQDGDERIMEVAALFVRIGVEPQLPGGCDELECDSRGFVQVDDHFRTSNPAIFAVGDVSVTPLRSVVTATGNGAVAARTCASDLGYL